MKIWRCAARRPNGALCRRRVGRRARWHDEEQVRIGEICPRCWREHIDAHDARLMEIARTPLAPAAVLRTLSRIGRPDLVAAIAARGDRVPADLRQRLAGSPDPNVQRALDVSGRVPLQHATWLYRSTPSPASAWVAWGLSIAAIAAVVIATVLIVVDGMAPSPAPPAPSRPGGAAPRPLVDLAPTEAASAPSTSVATTSVASASVDNSPRRRPTDPASPTAAGASTTTTSMPGPTSSTGPPTSLVVAASLPAPPSTLAVPTAEVDRDTRTLTNVVDVPGDAGSTCLIEAWVEGGLPFTLTGPSGSTRTGAGKLQFDGPAGRWIMTWRAPEKWAGGSTVGGGGCV